MPLNIDQYRKINGNTLKIIACLTMLIDHIGAAIIFPVYDAGVQYGTIEFETVKLIYDIMRFIGRTSFPIFCFLLVEGFNHTSNRLRYALSLFSFAIISEFPYDLAFNADNNAFVMNIFESYKYNKVPFSSSCNVMFTLLLGLLSIWAIDILHRNFELKAESVYLRTFFLLTQIISGAVFILLANYIHCDYKGYGIALIIIFYYLKRFEPLDIFAGYALISAMPNEAKSFPAFILMFLYNKKQGKKLGRLKYLFYAFYPVHLLVLFIIRCCIYG